MHCAIILPLFLQYLADIENLFTCYVEIHIGDPQ
jgi:hypothetical protein